MTYNKGKKLPHNSGSLKSYIQVLVTGCVQPQGWMRPRTGSCLLLVFLTQYHIREFLLEVTAFKGCGPCTCPEFKEKNSSLLFQRPEAESWSPSGGPAVLPCLHPHRAFSALWPAPPSTFLWQAHLSLVLWFAWVKQEDLVWDPLSRLFPKKVTPRSWGIRMHWNLRRRPPFNRLFYTASPKTFPLGVVANHWNASSQEDRAWG